MLRSSSHLSVGLPCFQYPFCLVDIDGFQLESSLNQQRVYVKVYVSFAVDEDVDEYVNDG